MRRIFLCCVLLAGCGLPRDADDALERARGGTLRVGMVVDTPWVTDSAGAAGGVEGEIARELARRLGARAVWVRAPEARLMASLKARELDLVIGGLPAKTPYAKEVGLSRPYYTDTVAVGAAPDRGAVSLEGREVFVKDGEPATAALRKQGAKPVPVLLLERAPRTLIAAPTWELEGLGMRPTATVLAKEAHVIAVAPGENALLLEVDRLLLARRDGIPARLRSAAR